MTLKNHGWPLLQLRNELDQPDRELRDFRRMSGNVQLAPKEDYEGPENVPGPYTQDSRAMWLKNYSPFKQILEIQIIRQKKLKILS